MCGNRCPPGMWGVNCNQSCDCFNRGECDHVTGKCTCKPGYRGEKVNTSHCTSINKACLGYNDCIVNSQCIDYCPKGFYGEDCGQECSCLNDANCNPVTGTCECKPGWIGKNCAEPACPNGRYGEQCKNTCECEPENTEM